MKSQRKFRTISVALVAGAVILLSECGATAAVRPVPLVHYGVYHNQGYGFTIDYPSAWKRLDPHRGGGGAWVTPVNVPGYSNGQVPGPYHDAVFNALGVINAAMGAGNGLDFHEMLSIVKHKLVPEDRRRGWQVSYGVDGRWIWMLEIQKVGSKAVSYWKSYMSLNTIEEFQLVFPIQRSKEFLPIWNKIDTSFKLGNGVG